MEKRGGAIAELGKCKGGGGQWGGGGHAWQVSQKDCSVTTVVGQIGGSLAEAPPPSSCGYWDRGPGLCPWLPDPPLCPAVGLAPAPLSCHTTDSALSHALCPSPSHSGLCHNAPWRWGPGKPGHRDLAHMLTDRSGSLETLPGPKGQQPPSSADPAAQRDRRKAAAGICLEEAETQTPTRSPWRVKC